MAAWIRITRAAAGRPGWGRSWGRAGTSDVRCGTETFKEHCGYVARSSRAVHFSITRSPFILDSLLATSRGRQSTLFAHTHPHKHPKAVGNHRVFPRECRYPTGCWSRNRKRYTYIRRISPANTSRRACITTVRQATPKTNSPPAALSQPATRRDKKKVQPCSIPAARSALFSWAS